MNSKEFTPISSYKSGRKASDQRLGDSLVEDYQDSDFVILGYPDDEGIKINGGRLGASKGPDVARKYLYKMTENPFLPLSPKIFDRGNLITQNVELKVRHEIAKKFVHKALESSKKLISIGGGHDYGYPDGAGFLNHCLDQKSPLKPIVINFDAHLDVRSTETGLSSGTPFFRLLNEYKDQFDFYQIGIQSQCNSREHINWCQEKGVEILCYDEIALSGISFASKASEFLAKALVKPRPCYLSIDIDAFSSSFAMGCSQSWPTGLSPDDFFPFFEVLLQRLNVLNIGVYELSPPLDQDDRTAKLVAQIIYKYLFNSTSA